MKIDLNLVILSYNHPELTARAIRSGLNFFSQQNILLVHNGSRVDYVEKFKNEFPQIIHLVLELNKGYSGGANAGLSYSFKNCQASHVLFLTNDCELISLPENKSNFGIIGPQILIRNTLYVDSAGGALHKKKVLLSHLRTKLEFTSLNEDYFPYIPGSAFIIDQKSFNSLQGFDEAFGTYWEDVDFSIRAKEMGISLQVDETFKVKHGIGKTCRKNKHYTLYLYHRNRELFAKKHVHYFPQNLPFWYFQKLKVALRLILSGRFQDLRIYPFNKA